MKNTDKFINRFGLTESEARRFCKDKTLFELSEIFNLNQNIVKSICNYHGLVWKRTYTKKVKPFPRNEMIKYLAEKFTYEDVGKVFNISRQRVEQIIKGE